MSSSTEKAAEAGNSETAGQYFDYYNGFYREISRLDAESNSFSKIERFLPPLSNDAKVLDIGAGHGSVSHELVKHGLTVHALEANAEAVEALRSKGFVAHVYDISLPIDLGETFDLILLLDVLEHVFDPVKLLAQATSHLNNDGRLIVTIPLYFDLIDRLRIIGTGKIVSYDNLCYGRELYSKFRSFNYDHIRFFRPKDLSEMARLTGLRIERSEYGTMPIYWKLPRFVIRFLTNPRNVEKWPGLLAHSLTAVLTRA
jgi:2-polyprenyl-3-methyl-5-hydroxy-6-metoxy-1,4-benzoquinol methylase